MATKSKKIIWKLPTHKILQEHNEGTEFALISEDYCQVHPLVYCKDFLQDAIQGFVNNKCIDIFRFDYDPNENPIHLKTTRLIIANKKETNFREKIQNSVYFVNQLETVLSMPRTKIFACQSPPEDYRENGIWFLEGSVRWLKCPPMISLYTMLLRIGLSHTAGDFYLETLHGIMNGNIIPLLKKDASLTKKSYKGIQWITKYGDRRIFYNDIKKNYSKEIGLFDMHNKCGIAGFSEGAMKDKMPYWYRIQESVC
jgi:hypothetical protein